MVDLAAILPVWAPALALEPVPVSFRGWLDRPELRYPLAAGLLLLLVTLVIKLPDITAWHRARHKQVLRPVDLEELMPGTRMVILDLRPTAAFAGPKGHLRGAHNVQPAELTRRLAEVAKEPNALVVLVDQTDRLSHRLAPVVEAAGYSWVRVLRGGMRAWLAKDLPVAVTGRHG